MRLHGPVNTPVLGEEARGGQYRCKGQGKAHECIDKSDGRGRETVADCIANDCYSPPYRNIPMAELLTDPQAWIALLTLTALELVLGIDNIIFISILVDKLPAEKRDLARRIGLFMAMFMRIGLLLVLSWIVGLTAPLFTLAQKEFAGRDIILIAGGLFLLWKSAGEIHQLLEGEEGSHSASVPATFSAVILQIMIIDLVFSLDSIITAVGMVDEVAVMIAAVIASVALMMLFAGAIGRFFDRGELGHPNPGGQRRKVTRVNQSSM